ncbi:flagellar hook-basal body complex protein FliE [Paenibacillus sp. GCM10027626]|uniref:flagellar hook-basal body complex protein FliE n=1 Tax=Paenibacillus sp. GCM10027626 TaxID=3273411 RepID=UPI003627E62E
MIQPVATQTIAPISTGAAPAERASKTPAEMTKSFGAYLDEALNGVASLEKDANVTMDKYLLGQVDASQLMIASQQAELSLQLTSQIRNKVIEAYQEIMRTQL